MEIIIIYTIYRTKKALRYNDKKVTRSVFSVFPHETCEMVLVFRDDAKG